MTILDRLNTMAILRGLPGATAVRTAEECWLAGIDLVEVPVQDGRSWLSLEAVIEASDSNPVGAGTVVSREQVDQAASIGARAVVSPGYQPDVGQRALDSGLEYLPGVMTPTEILRAWGDGFSTVKLFPAAFLGPSYISALVGPFPDVRLIAVGGVTSENIQTWLDAGAAGVGLGSGLQEALPALRNVWSQTAKVRP